MKKETIKKIFARGFIASVLIILYLPIVWLIVFSFSDSVGVRNFGNFTFQLYANLFAGDYSRQIFTALGNTLLISGIAASVATLLGTMAAIGIHYMRNKKIKRVYTETSQLPMVNADKVTAVSMVVLFVMLRSVFSLSGDVELIQVILAHIVFATPYVILSVMPRLARMDNNLYEAALDLGATPTQAVRKIILPQLFPGIIIGFLMSMMLSIDDFIITHINLRTRDTLSTFIYSSMQGRFSAPPEIRAFSSLIFLLILGILVGISIRNNKKKKMEAKKQ